MRLVLAAALVAFAALPAAAQRVDTRVIDARDLGDGEARCRFNAVPDMTLFVSKTPNRTYAEWTHKARDGDATLHALFAPAPPPQISATVDAFELPPGPQFGALDRAELYLDADPKPIPLAVSWSRSAIAPIRLTPPDDSLAEAMRYTDVASLRLLDRAGARIASYEFWIGDLQDVWEIPTILHWRCDGG